MKKDYYEILGVAKDTSVADIKKAYRSLALKYHPDRVPEAEKKAAEEKFKEISEAYGVLADAQKRKTYDQFGHSGIDQNYTAEDIFRGADFSSVFGEGGNVNLNDILSQMFGGGGDIFGGGGRGGGRRAARGRNIEYETEITLEEAYAGVRKTLKVPRHEHCPNCDGSGAKSAHDLKTCPHCHGQGQVVMSNGFFRMAQTCPQCQGRGKVIKEACPNCQGRGVVRVTRNIEVNIPPGVDSDSQLRVRGEGEVGSGGPGDLFLFIKVIPHPVFKRSENDLHMDLRVSFVKAALGGEVTVPTLSGPVSMKIPNGTQSGKVFRMKEKGMPDVHGNGKGDLYARVMVDVPAKLSAQQKTILEEFARASGETTDATESIKDKFKKVFK
jgi:molecular chaperone DnaJ